MVPIAASGQAIYSIAPQSDIAGTQQVVLGKKGQEILRSPKDFEKLKIGMPKGASITMAVQAMAKDAGIDFNKIQFVNLSPPDCVTALARGDIDAMAGWAPWVFNAVKQANGKIYFTGNRSYIPGKEGQVDWLLLHAGVVASGKMLKENPNTVKAVLRGLKKATATIHTNRDAAAKAVAAQMKIEEALTREIMALNIYSMEMNDKIYKGMGEFVDFLYTIDRIKQKMPPERHVLHAAARGRRSLADQVESQDRGEVTRAVTNAVPLASPPRQGRGGGLPRPVRGGEPPSHVPADAGEVDEIDLPSPRVLGGGRDAERRIRLLELLPRDRLPPRIEIRHVQANHEVLGELAVVIALKDELRVAVPKARVAVALPHLLESKVLEESTAGLVLGPAGHEGQE